MTAFLMVLLMAVLAFSVDVGYLFALKTELKRSADAAALAGAAALYDQTQMRTELYEYEHTVIPPEPEAARVEGQKFAGRNSAGSRTLQLDANAGNLHDGEIVIGCLSAGLTPPLRPTLHEPDSVLVRLPMREGHVNGAARLFFARVLGIHNTDLGESAMATVRPPGGLLPFAISEMKWDSRTTGGDGDSYIYRRGAGDFGVTPGSDGIPELNIFPGDWNGEGMPPGNFGLLFIGPNEGGPVVIYPQIDQGVSASDLDYHGGRLYRNMELSGKTGLKTGNKHALLGHPDNAYEGVLGQIRYIAVYSDATGNGANATFTLSKFVMVRIMAVKIDGLTRIARYDTEGEDITGFIVQPVTDEENFIELALTM